MLQRTGELLFALSSFGTLMAACGKQSPNPNNYQYANWVSFTMTEKQKAALEDLGYDSNAQSNTKPVKFAQAILLSVDRTFTPDNTQTLGFAFKTSETSMQVGVLPPALLNRESAQGYELYTRLGPQPLLGEVGICQISPNQEHPVAETFTPLHFHKLGQVAVSQMNLTIPLI